MAVVDDTAGQDGRIPVSIVAHTHWDREWYRPFQTYRHDLVRLLDALLPRLTADPGFRHFLLDGQTIVVDDFLEVRPEAEAAVRALAAEGRLALGPWAVLLDEFCVGGETIVRNLQRGLARAAALGGTLDVGYLPDMFGHVAQMPQLLRQAGLEHAVVWRGVPAAVDRTAFWWEAPDGSRVRAEHLWGSYANGRDVDGDPARLVALADSYAVELGDRRLPGGRPAAHARRRPPGPGADAARGRRRRQRRPGPLAVHDRAHWPSTWPPSRPTACRPCAASSARAPTPTCSWACCRTGSTSTRRRPPPSGRWWRWPSPSPRCSSRCPQPGRPVTAGDPTAPPSPFPFLALAWDRLIANSAHDSACACSVDEVVDHVLVRAREAGELAEAVTAEAMRWLAATVDAPPGAWVVANPSGRARGGVVEVETVDPGPGPAGLAQVVGREPPVETLSQLVVGPKVGWVEQLLDGTAFAGEPVAQLEIREGDAVDGVGGAEVVIRLAGPGEPAVDVTAARARLRPLAGADRVVRVRAVRPARTRWAVAVPTVPALGWTALGRADQAASGGEATEPVRAVAVAGSLGGLGLANGALTIAVEEAGTLRMATADGLSAGGLARLVDGGDGGDTYNFSPPVDDRLVDEPEAVAVTLAESGPVRGRLVVTTRSRWPTHAVGDDRRCTARADAGVPVTITTTYELRAGEAFVRVRHAFANPARDHRLRTHLPLPGPVDGSHAECAYAVVERGLVAEGGPHEPGLATWPSRRFVDAADQRGGVGLAVVHDGLLEHEVVGDGAELAITLLRAVGWLSRREPDLRPNPAGPARPTPGAQLLGERTADYAIVLHRGDWAAARLHAVAARVLTPLPVAAVGPGFGTRPASGAAVPGLDLGRAELAALRRTADGGVELRAFNPGTEPAAVRLPGGTRSVDLRGEPDGAGPDGALVLRPGAIATLRLPAGAVAAAWPPRDHPGA